MLLVGPIELDDPEHRGVPRAMTVRRRHPARAPESGAARDEAMPPDSG
jgi:hypothetical protein